MKEKYLIGDVSQLLRLSKDTLRYYDRLGIVSPKKDPSNNYRYYSIEDLLTLSYVLVFRDLEIPLEEIKRLIQNNTLHDFNELLDKQESLVDEKIAKLIRLKSTATAFKTHIHVAQNYHGKIQLCYSPALVYQPLKKEWDTTYADHLEEMNHNKNIIAPVFSVFIPDTLLLGSTPQTLVHYGISGVVKDLSDTPTLSRYHYIPPSFCLHTVIRAKEHIEPNDLTSITTYLSTHDLTPTGNILARNIAFEHCDQTPLDYYEIWLPVNKP